VKWTGSDRLFGRDHGADGILYRATGYQRAIAAEFSQPEDCLNVFVAAALVPRRSRTYNAGCPQPN